ncbi:MAG: radical SAM protein [Planctomycetes bacterium]|nr:radical SAM protein [Planctomycetota bacterium]
MRHAFENLEIHVAHACNLACESCTHYSNQGHKGLVSLEEADVWMTPWSTRLKPKFFSLVGGEPTIHPKLCDWVRLARAQFPDSTLRLVTNGFFLDRHPDLGATLAAVGRAQLYISIHHNSPAYRQHVLANLKLAERWHAVYGVTVALYPSYTYWQRTYHGSGTAMEPFQDSNPRSSWEHCLSREARQLYEGMLWKCSPLAYLPLQHKHHPLSAAWEPYLAYRPLAPDCSDEAIAEFLAREEEPTCAMCPAKPERIDLPVPLRNAP